MMKNTCLSLNLLLTFFFITIFSCTEDPIRVSGISLNTTYIEIAEGDTGMLVATVSPSNAANKKVIWTSSNSSIATVENGIVQALKSGVATISVMSDDGGKTTTCKVVVTKKEYANIFIDKITATTAEFIGVLNVDSSEIPLTKVAIYYSDEDNFKINSAQKSSISEINDDGSFHIVISGLKHGTSYQFCECIEINGDIQYGHVREFSTNKIAISIDMSKAYVGGVKASIEGNVMGLSPSDRQALKLGLLYSNIEEEIESYCGKKEDLSQINDDAFICHLSNLSFPSKYYIRHCIEQDGYCEYGDIYTFTTIDGYSVETNLDILSAIDLSNESFANCYIISKPGLFKFKTVKGNSDQPVGNVKTAAIIWESFGNSLIPDRCELIQSVYYENGYIALKTPDDFKEGNALIAAKDDSGKILWSWHIWLTDSPSEQLYYNGVGTMMDRNLGATSSTPGEVESFGLLYQWGRKDPFLSSGKIPIYISGSGKDAMSTITWPSCTTSSAEIGTIEYATANPTTFILPAEIQSGEIYRCNYDWYYNESGRVSDNYFWKKNKTIYDPCPAGWRVPDGGEVEGWARILKDNTINISFDNTNKGVNLSGLFSDGSIIWYPAAGYKQYDGKLVSVGHIGHYWTSCSGSMRAYINSFSDYNNGYIGYSDSGDKASGKSIRCQKE